MRTYRAQKAALTRAKNSGEPRKVIAEVDRAFAEFDANGWPDFWSNWQRAKDDAEFELRRTENFWSRYP